MKRRDFLKAVAGALYVAVVPNVGLPEPILPKPNKLHDIYISKDALEDIRKWGIYQIDDEMREAIYYNGCTKRMVSVTICSSS